MLIQRECTENIFVTSDEVNGVFDVDAFKNLMRGVSDQVCYRTDQPFGGIDDVGQRVLHGTAAGETAFVIRVAVCGTVKWKMLPGDCDDLHRLAESSAANGVAHRG